MTGVKRSFLFTALLLSGLLGANAQNWFIHTVQKGQGLYSISRTYGVTEADIIALNPGSDKLISAGQALKIPRSDKSDSQRYHTVAAGETIYGLANQNGITVKQLYDANPGLAGGSLQVGSVIIIPEPQPESLDKSPADNAAVQTPALQQEQQNSASEYKTRIEVQKKVTIYRICKDFGITEEEFLEANPRYRTTRLKIGDVVNIPYTESERAEQERQQQEQQRLLEEQAIEKALEWMAIEKSHRNHVKAALLLPLELDGIETSERAKMLEFTRGTLLAVNRLKDEGISVDLKIVDAGSEGHSIRQQLEELDEMDVVIGPKWSGQISEAARWSNRNGTPLVLPFNKNADQVFSSPHVFQLNTPQSYFIQEILDHFTRQFSHPNIIVLKSGLVDSSPLVDGLSTLAAERGYHIESLQVDTAAQTILDCLDPSRQNVFVIDSPESGPLLTMLPVLQLINRIKDPDTQCCLFGYPEYQIYAADMLEQFCECDTWFYSWFYTNNLMQESVEFGNDFIRAFGRQMMVSYPSYAQYGYDAAYYFLKGIARYGKDFESNLDMVDTRPVQMGFKFQRASNWGGFINRKVFFVHYSSEHMVEKIDFDK